ncbi:glycoside hydrolase family 10 protein [Deinococcus sp. VB343]|uniref:Family 10 glycosylhydrolase n=1 Tax=Deinococcus sp. VB142 TaxID=3112952 RepID=A0AAU6Q678_9DEIO
MSQRTPARLALAALSALLLAACDQRPVPEPAITAPGTSGEVRGLWVDAFGPGIRTPEEVTQLVDTARRANINTLMVQVGRRGDCYCNNAAMPRTDDPAVTPDFDPLADVIAKAHAQNIRVYAWIITTAIWNSTTPPKNADHAFNRHGLTATGRDNWLMVKNDGTTRGGADWLLDPGHPDAAEYIKNMYVSVAKNYDVDGVQFDRVRYTDYNPAVGGPNVWGYNPTALERYRTETGATGTPDPADPQWSAWRRQQVTNLVRETALAVKAVKPSVAVSAATITYGAGPADEAAFTSSRPYAEVLQDWLSWVKLGYLDQNVMMNYKRDFVAEQALWFDQWNSFAAALKAKYPLTEQVSGAAIYLNDQVSTVNQVKKAQAAGLGWAGYSYRTPDKDVNAGTRTKEQVWPELAPKLTTEAGAPFPTFVARTGTPASTLRGLSGRVVAGVPGNHKAELRNAAGEVVATAATDGSGRYGFLNVPQGRLSVWVDGRLVQQVRGETGRVVPLMDITLP